MSALDFIEQSASQRTNTINNRTFQRNIPSQTLQPYLDARPVSTKYSYLPIVDPRKPSNISLNQMPTFNIETTFNPGNARSPWSGYASNVNNESELRNQIYAHQSCSQSVYVPSSKSDLFQLHWNQIPIEQPFPNLFKEEKFNPHTYQHNADVGYALFNNQTRQQNKNININININNC
jgi:hypothetical protein